MFCRNLNKLVYLYINVKSRGRGLVVEVVQGLLTRGKANFRKKWRAETLKQLMLKVFSRPQPYIKTKPLCLQWRNERGEYYCTTL